MDLILGPYADAELEGLGPQDLDLFEGLLSENDPALYDWISGQVPIPQRYAAIINRVRQYHRIG